MTTIDYEEQAKTPGKRRNAGTNPRGAGGKQKPVRDDDRYLVGTVNVAKPVYNEENRSYDLLAKNKGKIRHQLSRRFLLDMYDDWRNHGTNVLSAVRDEDPATYLRVMASLIPKTLTIEDPNDGKSVGELRTELLVELGRALERGDAQLTEHVESLQRSERQGPTIEVRAVREAEDVSPEREDTS